MKPLMRITVITLATVAIFSCSADNKEEKSAAENKNPVVRIVHPIDRIHQRQLEYSGTIRPWREANLGTSIPGRVEKIYFGQGSAVNEGALIARLSAEPEIMARVEKETLKNDYNRLMRLRERGSITQQDFEHIEAQYKAAQAKHQMMEKNTEIRAPFAGHIMEILVQEGETFFFMPALQPGSSISPGIVRLMQLNPLKAAFHIPEKELPLVREATDIRIKADALPDKEFSASLHKIAPMVAQNNRTIAVEAKIDSPGNELMVGMYVKVNVVLPDTKQLFIPVHTIEQSGDTEFVWVVDSKNTAVRKAVVRLFAYKGEAAVTGLNPDDQVVVAGRSGLEEGLVVEIVK